MLVVFQMAENEQNPRTFDQQHAMSAAQDNNG